MNVVIKKGIELLSETENNFNNIGNGLVITLNPEYSFGAWFFYRNRRRLELQTSGGIIAFVFSEQLDIAEHSSSRNKIILKLFYEEL